MACSAGSIIIAGNIRAIRSGLRQGIWFLILGIAHEIETATAPESRVAGYAFAVHTMYQNVVKISA
jgi:hypothetical protein